ncbi:MAG: serine hydrolase domain-containing protein [Myxococcota bacterium]
MLTLLMYLTAAAGSCPTASIPSNDWQEAPDVDAAADAVAKLEAYAFPAQMDEDGRTGVRTDGLVIARGDTILYERYGRDFTADTPHLQWSASKSVATTLTGMAAHRGYLDIDASICDHVTSARPESCQITPRHLMEFSSGLAWRESYEGQSPTASSVISMLFGEGVDDMVRFITNHELRDPPGTSYSYSSGDTTLLSGVVTAAMAKKHGERFAWTELFEPMGITSAVFEEDRSGVFIGSSYLYLTPRDMARYGTLLKNDGCWGQQRMLPEGWMAKASQPLDSLHGRLVDGELDGVPGWGLWLNKPVPHLNIEAPDSDTIEFWGPRGHWRQAIYIVPELDLVIARTGDDRDDTYAHGALVELAVAAAKALAPPEPPPPPQTADVPADPPEVSDPGSDVEEETPAPAAPPSVDPVTRWAFEPLPAAVEGTPTAEAPEKYDLGLLKIASGYAAKEACSCLFVTGRTEEACRAYIKVKPDVAKIKIDWDDKTVRARSLFMGKVVAKHISTEEGCRVVD